MGVDGMTSQDWGSENVPPGGAGSGAATLPGGRGGPAPRTRGQVPDRPPAPTDFKDLGVGGKFFEQLVLKTLYTRGSSTGDQLSEYVRVPFWTMDDILMGFQRQQLAQTPKSVGMGRRGYTFELTAEGRARAREVLETDPYVGACPVPLDVYSYWMERQSVRGTHVGPDQVRAGFEHLVLDTRTIDLLGPAINSARSVFLWGDAGNGKTTISEAVVKIYGDSLYIPLAVYADGQVIQLYDPVVHEPVEPFTRTESEEEDLVWPPPDVDQRWVRIKRPMVLVGGELTLDQLELKFDKNRGAFQAPPHMKANGGVFVIDDFGRQHVPPRDLLNRWMVPLDRGVDYLTFTSGRRASIPFACVVIFATNLDPEELVEEAFLRRIRYKIEIGSPERAHVTEILRRQCERRGIPFRPEAVDFLYREYYDRLGIEPRSCHPVDLVGDLQDLAAYLSRKPELTEEMLRHACDSYFMGLQQKGGKTISVYGRNESGKGRHDG
jgi:hypothetical protein